MEEKMLKVLQDAVDAVKEARELGCSEMEKDAQARLMNYREFYEEVTGNHVYVSGWKVFKA